MKFTATIVIIAHGEVDLQADNINVFTAHPLTVLYPVMTVGAEGDMPEDKDAKELVNRVIAHNVTHSALAQLDVPGVTRGVPAPITAVPPGERS